VIPGSSPQEHQPKGKGKKMSTVPTNDEQLRAEVSARYARTALQVLGKEQPWTAADACCAPTCCTPNTAVPAESRTALPVVAAEPAQASAC
jgi:hypothetical protein